MRSAFFLLTFAAATTANAVDLIDPNKLQTPSEPTCIYLKDPVAVDAYQTVFKWHWIYTLASGPYVAEKLDAKGTYYRAPPGGLSIVGIHHQSSPPEGTPRNTRDGGFYLPNDANAVPAVYEYNSNGQVPVQIPPSDADCSTAGYVKEPATSKISLFAWGTAGVVGGATGATIARSTVAANSKMSYGHAAGVGAGGGLLAGLIVGAIINHEMGKIVFAHGIDDQESLQRLKGLAANKVPVKQVDIADQPGGSQPASPTQAKE